MPVDKQVLLRYQVLNKCFRNRYREYTIDDLVDECNKALRRLDKPDVSKRTEYDKRVIKNLSIKLTERYGTGWSFYKLRHCIRSAETFSEDEIVSATQRQLTWTHLKSLMYIKDPLERQFYAQMCSIEHWDTRTLDEKIDMLRSSTSRLAVRPGPLLEACMTVFWLIPSLPEV